MNVRSGAGHLSEQTRALRSLLGRSLGRGSMLLGVGGGRGRTLLGGSRRGGSRAGRGARRRSAATSGTLTRHLEELLFVLCLVVERLMLVEGWKLVESWLCSVKMANGVRVGLGRRIGGQSKARRWSASAPVIARAPPEARLASKLAITCQYWTNPFAFQGSICWERLEMKANESVVFCCTVRNTWYQFELVKGKT